jgi:hypothetical protein
MTNGIECFLRPLPPPAQKELLDWIDAGNEGAVDKFFADAMARSLLLDSLLSKTGEKIATRVANRSFARTELHF